MHENFFHKIKVYYEDTDSGGVVYYANYLKFLERARTEALFSIGFSNKKIEQLYGLLIIVKSCNIDYKKSAYLENELTIRSFVKSITKTSFLMNQLITKGEDLITEAQVHLVKKFPIDRVDVKLSCETPKPKAPPSDLCKRIEIIKIIARIMLTKINKLSMVFIYSNSLLYQ